MAAASEFSHDWKYNTAVRLGWCVMAQWSDGALSGALLARPLKGSTDPGPSLHTVRRSLIPATSYKLHIKQSRSVSTKKYVQGILSIDDIQKYGEQLI